MTDVAWERVDVLDVDVPDDPMSPGRLDLADGRRLTIPGDVGRFDPQSPDWIRIVDRRLEMMRCLRITRPNVRIDGDRLVAVARRYRWHPVDAAIVRAMGHDVDAAHRAFSQDPAWWSGERPDPRIPADFYSTTGGRIGCSIEMMDGVLYGDLELSVDREFPDTVAATLVGRQLSEVVGLPQLVDVDAPITFCETKDKPFGPGRHTLLWVGDEADWRLLD